MLSFFPRGVLDEILNLIQSVFEGFPSYSYCAVLSWAMVELCVCVILSILILRTGCGI